jgi:transposase-like protein
MTKRKNVYTAEFKAEAVKMINEYGIEKTIQDLGVSKSSLVNWSKKSESKASSNKPLSLNDVLKENRRLEKEIMYIKKINEVLKKSTAIFSQGELPPSK